MEPTDEVRAIGPCDDRDDLPLHRLAHRHDDSPMPPSLRSAVQLIAFDGLSQASVGVPYSADGRPRALGQRVDILRPPRADRAARDVSTARATFWQTGTPCAMHPWRVCRFAANGFRTDPKPRSIQLNTCSIELNSVQLN